MLYNQLAPVLSLDGAWEFSLQPGVPAGTIRVPGCWETQGYPRSFEGPAFYRTSFALPDGWPEGQTLLEFDAVAYATVVRVNGHEVGAHLGMWTPFSFDITHLLNPNAPNVLEVEVTKPGSTYPMRTTLAGFLPDVALPFGGIWQSVRLRAVAVGIDSPLLFPNPDTGEINVRCGVMHLIEPRPDRLQITVSSNGQALVTQSFPIEEPPSGSYSLRLPAWELWSPDHPVLYQVQIDCTAGGRVLASVTLATGFRRLSTQSYQLVFNGQPVSLRGILHWGWDPERIAPNFPEELIRAEFRQLRSLGFNLVKLCLFIPNPLFYTIADQEGMFLWQEWPLWTPEVAPTRALMDRAPAEYAEYMDLAQTHPSIVVYSLGCELQGFDPAFMGALDQAVRARVANVLFCDNSGSNEIWSAGQHHDLSDFSDYHIYSDIHDFEPILDHFRRDWMAPRPWLSGEFNDSDTFRDLRLLSAANQGRLPWWATPELLLYQTRSEALSVVTELDRLGKANLEFEPQEIVKISYRQSLVIRKYVLELLRRREATCGYVITGMRDTPISTSGVFDDLGQPKWSPEEFTPFNSPAVLTYDIDRRTYWPIHSEHLLRLDRANFWSGENQRIVLILSNLGAPLPAGCRLDWALTAADGTQLAAESTLLSRAFPTGRPLEAATLRISFPETQQAQQNTLHARITWPEGEIYNQWPLWSYPKPDGWTEGIRIDDPSGALDELLSVVTGSARAGSLAPGLPPSLVISSALTGWVVDYLNHGGKVLLLQQGAGPLPSRRGPFWREAVKLFSPHPIWKRFPHQGYTDMQFFGLSTEILFEPGCVESFFPGVVSSRSLMKRLDAREFYTNDYLLEAHVGKGSLLACSLRLQGGDGAQPVPMRRNVAGVSLLWEMVKYLIG